MKKISYVIVLLILITVFIFYIIINIKGGFSNKKYNGLTEAEKYCIFKGGKLENTKGGMFCINGKNKEKVDDFLLESLRRGEDVKKINI